MKYKIIIILILGTIITSIIYYLNNDKDKFNVLALGDGLSTGMTAYHVEGYDFNDYLVEYLNEENNLDNYYNNFNEVDETVTNLINKINNNITTVDKKIKIKQAIKEANIITVAIGMDELNNYALKNTLGSTKINGYLNKMDELLKILNSLNDKEIYIISLYSTNLIPNSKLKKINKNLEDLTKSYNNKFIDIEDITNQKEYFIFKNNYYLNYKGQKYIFDKIKPDIIRNTFKVI